jgi:hypothetical protein
MRVRHRNDGRFQTGSSDRDGLMKVVGESRDAAAPWKVIADKRNPTYWAHEESFRRSLVSSATFMMNF